MTASERAAQIWAILALAAKSRQVLTYEILSRLTGVPRPALGRFLEPIQSYCLLNEFPALTSLVVSTESGLPSPGFVAANDVPLMQLRVFDFDWLAHGNPGADKLEAAVRQLPSNGIRNPEMRTLVDASE